MHPTDTLKEEHVAIKSMLEIIDGICSRLERKEKIPPVHLDRILDFLRTFADKCHHHKEEQILFPEMENAGIPGQGGPIGVMLYEHTVGREHVRGISEAVERYKNDAGDTEDLIANGRAYVALLSQHIFKEDNILYPMAERVLPEDVMDAMNEAFGRVEEDLVGAGKHEDYHRLLKELRTIYL